MKKLGGLFLLLSLTACKGFEPQKLDQSRLGDRDPREITLIIERVTGNEQTALVGTSVAIQPRVRLRYSNGSPLTNQTLLCEPKGGSSVSITNPVTDANGEATCGDWTLPNTPMTSTLSVYYGAINVFFVATASEPVDPRPVVNFALPSASVSEDYRIVDIFILLSKPADAETTISISVVENSTVKQQCCRAIKDNSGNDINVDHYDRDVQDFDQNRNTKINTRVDGKYQVTFPAGIGTAVLKIKVVADDRVEDDELLNLQIDPIDTLKVGEFSNFSLEVKDDDEAPVAPATTYSELMEEGGVLGANCVKCHNSVSFRGNYDLSNYELLVATNKVVPFSPEDSLIHIRINGLNDLPQMPPGGLLSVDDRILVDDWLFNGGKNN